MLRIVFLFVMRIGQGMVLPIRKCKDSERRVQKQMGNEVSRIDSAEPPPIFAYSAKIANYLGIAEYLILKKTYAGRFAIFARIHPVYVFVNSIGWDTGGYNLDK